MSDDPALRAQLESLHGASFGWAMACSGRRRSEAEEVLQQSYLKVLSGRAVFRGDASFKTWLFGVIRLTALEQRRWFSRRRELPDELPAPGSEPKVDRQTAEILSAAMADLPDRQREVLHLVFYEGLSIAEAAVIMGVALGTGRLHYERGKAALHEVLQRRGVSFR